MAADLSLVPYRATPANSVAALGGGARYRQCMRNHAAAIGSHAFDGCGEFMPPAGRASLNCDACGCHRNFHRRDDSPLPIIPRPIFVAPPPTGFPCAFVPVPVPYRQIREPAVREESETTPSPPPRKRCRTRFTAEQKVRMVAFAEGRGWRIPKRGDVALRELCGEIGIDRHVLKEWMRNHKNGLISSSAAAAAGASDRNTTAAAAAAPINV